VAGFPGQEALVQSTGHGLCSRKSVDGWAQTILLSLADYTTFLDVETEMMITKELSLWVTTGNQKLRKLPDYYQYRQFTQSL
jgi:hypothetical protein